MPINPYAPGKDDYTPPRKSAPPTLGVGVMLGLMVTIGANFGAYAMGLDPHNADISISTLVILTAIVAMITAAAVMTGDRPALGAVIMILAFTPYPVFHAAQALR